MRAGDDGEKENQAPLGQTRPGLQYSGLQGRDGLILSHSEETLRSPSSLPIVGSLRPPNENRLLKINFLI